MKNLWYHIDMYELWKKIINILGIVLWLIAIAVVIYLWHIGLLTDKEMIANLIKDSGILGPVIFAGLQIIQVVFPIIPGGVSTVVGFLIFGLWMGFLVNYIGLTLGSLLAFWLSKRFGRKFVLLFIKQATFDKYEKRIESSKGFERFFIAMMIIPFAPTDLIVMMAGLTDMSYRKLLWTMLWTKPISILSFSYLWIYGGEFIKHLL